MKNLFHSIFLIIVIFPFYNPYAQNSHITFEHFSVDQGISGVAVPCIYQDSVGYLWFGCFEGIDRYDGYSFTSYRHDPDDTASLVSAFVNTLCEDKAGNFWVGTEGGLDELDRASGKFTHYLPHDSGPGAKQGNIVTSIHEDRDGLLWIGTGDGLNIFDRSNGKFTCFRDNITDPGGGYNSIRAICEDRSGLLWIGTDRGLNRFDKKSRKFIHYWHDFNHMNRTDNWINSIYEDGSGMLWLGGGTGLVAFDLRTGTFTQYAHDPADPQSLSSNEVSSISEDKTGHLWVGTYHHGVNVFDKGTKSFTHYVHNEKDPGSLSSNGIYSVYCERSGTIWVSTPDKGINKLNWVKPPFTSYLYDDQAPLTTYPQVFADNTDRMWVHATNEWQKFDPKTESFLRQPMDKDSYPLLDDRAGNLWIGKESGGLYKRDHRGHSISFHDSAGLKFLQVPYCLIETRDGHFWMGTTDGGLYAVYPGTLSVRRVQEGGSEIETLFEDTDGLLWIGTWNDGLLCYDPRKETVVRYRYDPKNPASLGTNYVGTLYEDKKGTLWIGAIGLDRFDRTAGTFTHFTVRDGLPGDPVGKIMEDDHGNLWLGTFKGISKFDPKTRRFKNYSVSDGLADNIIRIQSGCRTKNGEMYFGGKGLTRFHPDSIRDNLYVPPIVVMQFRLFEKPYPVGNEIHLSHTENFISFEFAALSFVNPDKNQYAYKMEGIDKDWVYSGKRRFASYPNLDPGEYIFRVKGSNNNGVWNEAGTSIAIFISPPWWETWWAYSAYGSIFIFALYWIRRYELNRAGLKNKIKMDEAVLKEREETDRVKSRFFANISHEFRTPLTLILGPAEKIFSKTSDNITKDADIIRRNSRRLLQLINQLLDLSKLEAGKLKLEASKGNIVPFVKGVALSFESLAESKDITLKLQPEKDFIEVYFDKEKMMKILTNIISNAFKFTPEEGKITVSVNTKSPLGKEGLKGGSVEIKIRDTGIGIAQEEIPKLFDRFYQVDSSHTREYEGTGIGLALTKELVELHHGRISVESEKGMWTEFTLEFPPGRDHLKDEEIIQEKTDVILSPVENGTKNLPLESNVLIKNSAFSSSINNQTPQNEIEKDEEKTIILVVEDNYDMRQYIRDSLNGNYLTEEAVNGEQGVRKAEKIIPDLIISDMMMPKMDGNELVRILKNDEKTSHIPIILLTAKAGLENKIEGLETGADDYLTKPFDVRELRARIENLIKIRRKLQAKYSKLEYVLKPDGKKGTSLDEKFMIKVGEVIEKHISEEEFNMEEFCSEVAMSRTQLHRKLKALTGKSATLYIRTVKLSKAKKMIEERIGNISEIAYSLGFSNPAYFTKCFKEEFGYPPSDIKK